MQVHTLCMIESLILYPRRKRVDVKMSKVRRLNKKGFISRKFYTNKEFYILSMILVAGFETMF